MNIGIETIRDSRKYITILKQYNLCLIIRQPQSCLSQCFMNSNYINTSTTDLSALVAGLLEVHDMFSAFHPRLTSDELRTSDLNHLKLLHF